MTHLLRIVSSPRGNDSFSKKLGDAIVEKIKSTRSDIQVKEHLIHSNAYPHLENIQITSYFTPDEYRTEEQKASIKISDDTIQDWQAADILVIDSPIHNFTLTSNLKAYFDHLARTNITFRFTETGWEGLLKGKKAFIAIASGSYFDNDVMRPFDFATPYIKLFLNFLGIEDLTFFRIEGTSNFDYHAIAYEKALAELDAHNFEA